MYDPRSPTLAAVEEERKTLCDEEELHDMGDDSKKKRRAYLSSHESVSIQPRRDTNFPCLNLFYFFLKGCTTLSFSPL